ncbi:MAG: hypothetical protein KF847_03635 [Pirellulales bacterium]|nr:hypothetical protein [Pirellulales bacterium]
MPLSRSIRSPRRRAALFAAVAIALVGCGGKLLARKPPWRETATGPRPIATAGQLVFFGDAPLDRGRRLLDELAAQRTVIADRLALPMVDRRVHVYLYADEETYRREMKARFPDFQDRRAIFVDDRRELAVYAHWSELVADDLRHEVAHGHLHAAVPNLPLWLDEGLAEFFEVGAARRGLNQPHVDYLLGQLDGGGWRPRLARLETLDSAAEMSRLDYAESWLWVHFLLESEGNKSAVLTDYLAELQMSGTPLPLSDHLARRLGRPDAAVVEHLRSLGP